MLLSFRSFSRCTVHRVNVCMGSKDVVLSLHKTLQKCRFGDTELALTRLCLATRQNSENDKLTLVKLHFSANFRSIDKKCTGGGGKIQTAAALMSLFYNLQ